MARRFPPSIIFGSEMDFPPKSGIERPWICIIESPGIFGTIQILRKSPSNSEGPSTFRKKSTPRMNPKKKEGDGRASLISFHEDGGLKAAALSREFKIGAKVFPMNSRIYFNAAGEPVNPKTS